MTVVLPEDPAPRPSVRFTWTLHLTSDGLSALVETSISDPLIKMRVRPSGRPETPHLVKVTVDAEAADAVRVFNRFDADPQRHHIG